MDNSTLDLLKHETKYYLYKIIDVNKLVYVGRSKNIDKRIDTHNIIASHYWFFEPSPRLLRNPLIYVANIEDELRWNIYETMLISKYKPIYNTNQKYQVSSNVKLPKISWFPYLTEGQTEEIMLMRYRMDCESGTIDTPLKRWITVNRGLNVPFYH